MQPLSFPAVQPSSADEAETLLVSLTEEERLADQLAAFAIALVALSFAVPVLARAIWSML